MEVVYGHFGRLGRVVVYCDYGRVHESSILESLWTVPKNSSLETFLRFEKRCGIVPSGACGRRRRRCTT